MSESTFAEVAFPLPLNRAFHYRMNGNKAPVGSRVLAPFGKKILVGYVVAQTAQPPPFATKSILECLDPEPFIDEMLLELARWVSERYLCSLGEALACVVPPALAAPKRPRAGERASGRAKDLNEIPGSPAPPLLRSSAHSLKLSAEQKRVLAKLVDAVKAGAYRPFLLRGITDSGKTELYLRAIDHALRQGRQALYLLPEIALTPPFAECLRQRYRAEKAGLWHSGLAGGERYRTWMGVKKGEIQVLLGARSAVFAPFSKLGVIVLDEEHEPSYKQEDRPRYHTREVALKRAQQTHAVLIMGSATPSLESYWKAKQGIYTLLELTSRVEQRSLPPVELIDRSPKLSSSPAVAGGGSMDPRQRRSGMTSFYAVFSEPLKLAIEQRLAKREQVMLFVNRRGFTPFLRCGACGWVARCSRCSTTLALHLGSGLSLSVKTDSDKERPDPGRYLQCHACLRREPVAIQCPACKSMRLHQYGVGTQKVEEELKKLFPFAKVARLDRDIGSQRRVYENIYHGFAAGRIDLLVGTQMIAKGFDFPKVTLVGVVDADVSLHLPDFRAAERTFDLITQVAGRTGRGPSRGQVLVQTHHPEHYALQAAETHDYLRFYEQEIAARERLRYPPFCRLVNILLRGSKESAVRESADQLCGQLEVLQQSDILGPAPAPYSRLRNQFRYQIILKGTDQTLGPSLRFLRSYRPPKAFMSVDVDPMDLL